MKYPGLDKLATEKSLFDKKEADFWISVDYINPCTYDSVSDKWWQPFPLPLGQSTVTIGITLHNPFKRTLQGKILGTIDGASLQTTPSCSIIELPPNSNPAANLWLGAVNSGKHKINLKYRVIDHIQTVETVQREGSRIIGTIQRPVPVFKTLTETEIDFEVAEIYPCDHSDKIEHVFVLMLENRSFDHMLGFSGISGRDSISGVPTEIDGLHLDSNGIGIESNYFNSTTFPVLKGAPFALIDQTDHDKNQPDPGHDFADVAEQLASDKGRNYESHYKGTQYKNPPFYEFEYPHPIDNSGYVSNYHRRLGPNDLHDNVMMCFSPSQLPILNTLAKEFAVCDKWFSSVPGPTWPNRFFVHAATSGGMDDNQTDEEMYKAFHDSPAVAKVRGILTWATPLLDIIGSMLGIPPGTIGPILGISSVVYGDGLGYEFENGTIYDRLDAKNLKWTVYGGDDFSQVWAIKDISKKKGRITSFDNFANDVNKPDFNDSYVFIEPRWAPLKKFQDIISSGPENSQHPPGDIRWGECLIKEVYEVIRNSPHWEKSALIITYDEHGGFYDHVVPPQADPPGDIPNGLDNYYGFDFRQLGVRVPAIVISPLIPKNTIDHTFFYDHTSILATLEKRFSLEPLTNRDRNAKSLNHLFGLSTPRTDAPLRLPACDFYDEQFKVNVKSKQSQNIPGSRDRMDSMEWGFFRIALIRDLLSSQKENRIRIINLILKIKNKGQAARYIVSVEKKLKIIDRKKSKQGSKKNIQTIHQQSNKSKIKRKFNRGLNR